MAKKVGLVILSLILLSSCASGIAAPDTSPCACEFEYINQENIQTVS